MPPMPELVRPGLMNARNIGAAAVAAAVALAAFFLIRMAFPEEEPAPPPPPVVEVAPPAPEPEPEPEPPPPEPEPEPQSLLPVTLVAKQYIAPGVQLRADMVEWQEWSGELNTDFALLEDEVPIDNVLGALTKLAIEEGTLISWDKIIVPGGAGFLTSMLAPGHRAVTVEVDRATTAANIIRPGDRVDVILMYSGDLPALAGLGPVAQMIARNVLVLAVGSYTIETHPFFAGTIGDTLAKIAETAPPQGDTYTLEVPVQDAERLALASRQITLALRPYGTNDAMRHPRLIGFKDVITALPEPEQAQAPPSVRVIRGVRRVESVVDAPPTRGAGA